MILCCLYMCIPWCDCEVIVINQSFTFNAKSKNKRKKKRKISTKEFEWTQIDHFFFCILGSLCLFYLSSFQSVKCEGLASVCIFFSNSCWMSSSLFSHPISFPFVHPFRSRIQRNPFQNILQFIYFFFRILWREKVSYIRW